MVLNSAGGAASLRALNYAILQQRPTFHVESKAYLSICLVILHKIELDYIFYTYFNLTILWAQFPPGDPRQVLLFHGPLASAASGSLPDWRAVCTQSSRIRKRMNNIEYYWITFTNFRIFGNFLICFRKFDWKTTDVTIFWNLARNPEKIHQKFAEKMQNSKCLRLN